MPMDIKYKTEIEITLVPTYHSTPPEIKYGIDECNHYCILTEPTVIKLQENLFAGKHCFIIDFFNKTNDDCIPDLNLDKTITIKDVKIGSIQTDKFKWISEYTPRYPEPWYSEQLIKPAPTQFGATVLGFNGEWKINFSSPVYTWIHQIENLGWIWPV
jgi:hypothetical protein